MVNCYDIGIEGPQSVTSLKKCTVWRLDAVGTGKGVWSAGYSIFDMADKLLGHC